MKLFISETLNICKCDLLVGCSGMLFNIGLEIQVIRNSEVQTQSTIFHDLAQDLWYTDGSDIVTRSEKAM